MGRNSEQTHHRWRFSALDNWALCDLSSGGQQHWGWAMPLHLLELHPIPISNAEVDLL